MNKIYLIISLALGLLITLSFFKLHANEEPIELSLNYALSDANDAYAVSGLVVESNKSLVPRKEAVIKILDSYNGLPITKINQYAFSAIESFNKGLSEYISTFSSISLDFSMATNLIIIENFAFSDLKGISKIEITNCPNLKIIGPSAFSKQDMSEVIISNCPNLEQIGSNAFSFCENLKKVDLLGVPALKTISMRTFSSCYELTQINFDDECAIEAIEYGAFAYTMLYSFDFSKLKSLKTIGEAAFAKTNISEIDLRGLENLESIDDYAFYGTQIETAYMGYILNIGHKIFVNSSINLIVINSKDTYDIYSNDEHNMSDYKNLLGYEVTITFISGKQLDHIVKEQKLYNQSFCYEKNELDKWYYNENYQFPIVADYDSYLFDEFINKDGVILNDQIVNDTIFYTSYSLKDSIMTPHLIILIALGGSILAVVIIVFIIIINKQEKVIKSNVLQKIVKIPASLTDREREILILILSGMNAEAISDSLKISLSTTKKHITSILKKSDCKSQKDLIIKYE